MLAGLPAATTRDLLFLRIIIMLVECALELLQEECNTAGNILLSGGHFAQDVATEGPVNYDDLDYPMSYTVREATYVFQQGLTLRAGRYRVCWTLQDTSEGLPLGHLDISGTPRFSHVDGLTGLLPRALSYSVYAGSNVFKY